MTANLAPDPERVLDAYADATRIVASGPLIRRFQAGVAEERARSTARPWSGALARLTGVPLRLRDSFDAAFAPRVTFALRLQSLALVLLTVLALSAIVGGAGAIVVEVVTGPDRGATLPGFIVDPERSPIAVPIATPVAPALPQRSTSRLPAPSPTAVPRVTVRVLAQEAPRRARDGKRRKAADHHVVATSGCPVSLIARADGASDATWRSWSRQRSCAS